MSDNFEVIDFYCSDNFNPLIPSSSGFRHYRFKDVDGRWRKVPDKIHNRDELFKWIVKLGGVDLYYSTSLWLNPQKISAKGVSGTYHVADNLLLGYDLVFDVDAEPPVCLESLDVARMVTSNIHHYMKDFSDRFVFQYLEFTGYKGFRLVYHDQDLQLPEDARKRLDYADNNRKVFIQAMINNMTERTAKKGFYDVPLLFDRKVSENLMNVIRIVGSVHSKTKYLSQQLNPKELKKPIQEIINNIPHVGKERFVIPKREMIQEEEEKIHPQPRLLPSGEDVSNLASTPNLPDRKYFFSNRVLGIKRGYVPVFIYQLTQKGVEKELYRLQEKYRLGHLYQFTDEKHLYVLSLKIMQRRNLQRVLNDSSSRTKWTFLKHKKIFVPFFLTKDKKIRGKRTGNLSLGHSHYVEDHKEELKNAYSGWEQIELVTGYYEQEEVQVIGNR